jgi:hypothetical protein
MERRRAGQKLRGDTSIVLLKTRPPKRDHTHTIIIALSTIIAAYIVSRK